MGNGCMKCNENMYFKCRKEAALYNDNLNSRENAAELLGVSTSSLADYELGNTKVVPVDKVVLMADLYKSPQLLNMYCKDECPIGYRKQIATEIKTLERTAICLSNLAYNDQLGKCISELNKIAENGKIDDDEQEKMIEVIGYLDKLKLLVEELDLYYLQKKSMQD